MVSVFQVLVHFDGDITVRVGNGFDVFTGVFGGGFGPFSFDGDFLSRFRWNSPSLPGKVHSFFRQFFGRIGNRYCPLL